MLYFAILFFSLNSCVKYKTNKIEKPTASELFDRFDEVSHQESQNEIENHRRDYFRGIMNSRDIDDYKPTLEYLVDSDYQIFITGEVTNIPDWINKFGNSAGNNSGSRVEPS